MAGSTAAPAARCRNCRRGSFISFPLERTSKPAAALAAHGLRTRDARRPLAAALPLKWNGGSARPRAARSTRYLRLAPLRKVAMFAPRSTQECSTHAAEKIADFGFCRHPGESSLGCGADKRYLATARRLPTFRFLNALHGSASSPDLGRFFTDSHPDDCGAGAGSINGLLILGDTPR